MQAAGSDRCVRRLIRWETTAVWLHKQADRLQLGFISCLIDYCWHNSCQWRERRLTNDSAGSAVREITSTLSEATQQSSLHLSQCFFTATLNHCPTDNTDKTPANTFGLHGNGSRWTNTSASCQHLQFFIRTSKRVSNYHLFFLKRNCPEIK